jgi:hypothetical protein
MRLSFINKFYYGDIPEDEASSLQHPASSIQQPASSNQHPPNGLSGKYSSAVNRASTISMQEAFMQRMQKWR